jgi:ubiquitin carboxyl-terminal hydrolase 25/28
MDVDAPDHRDESSQPTADHSNTLTEDFPPAYNDSYCIIADDENALRQECIENKENHAPANAASNTTMSTNEDNTMEEEGQVDADRSARNAETETMHTDAVMANGNLPSPPPEAPVRPPPIPPRPISLDASFKATDPLAYGAQQDVTEVISNVMFQLECAIRPTRIDPSGEQHDDIKE